MKEMIPMEMGSQVSPESMTLEFSSAKAGKSPKLKLMCYVLMLTDDPWFSEERIESAPFAVAAFLLSTLWHAVGSQCLLTLERMLWPLLLHACRQRSVIS